MQIQKKNQYFYSIDDWNHENHLKCFDRILFIVDFIVKQNVRLRKMILWLLYCVKENRTTNNIARDVGEKKEQQKNQILENKCEFLLSSRAFL